MKNEGENMSDKKDKEKKDLKDGLADSIKEKFEDLSSDIKKFSADMGTRIKEMQERMVHLENITQDVRKHIQGFQQGFQDTVKGVGEKVANGKVDGMKKLEDLLHQLPIKEILDKLSSASIMEHGAELRDELMTHFALVKKEDYTKLAERVEAMEKKLQDAMAAVPAEEQPKKKAPAKKEK
jgi:hypothetical protein